MSTLSYKAAITAVSTTPLLSKSAEKNQAAAYGDSHGSLLLQLKRWLDLQIITTTHQDTLLHLAIELQKHKALLPVTTIISLQRGNSLDAKCIADLSENVTAITKILTEQINFQPNANSIISLGDNICDRTDNDFFTYFMVSKLVLANIDFEICYSNHDAEAIIMLLMAYSSEHSKELAYNAVRQTTIEHIISHLRLIALINHNIVTLEQLKPLFFTFLSRITLAPTVVSQEQVIFYNHAPTNIFLLALCANQLLPRKDIPSKLKLENLPKEISFILQLSLEQQAPALISGLKSADILNIEDVLIMLKNLNVYFKSNLPTISDLPCTIATKCSWLSSNTFGLPSREIATYLPDTMNTPLNLLLWARADLFMHNNLISHSCSITSLYSKRLNKLLCLTCIHGHTSKEKIFIPEYLRPMRLQPATLFKDLDTCDKEAVHESKAVQLSYHVVSTDLALADKLTTRSKKSATTLPIPEAKPLVVFSKKTDLTLPFADSFDELDVLEEVDAILSPPTKRSRDKVTVLTS